jgi:hypothetical protein
MAGDLRLGQQRYQGIDVEGVVRPVKGLTVKGNIGWSDARYRDFLTEINGILVQLAGNHQVLTPSVRVSGGLLYAAERGWRGSLTSNWIGKHWLNSFNTPGTGVRCCRRVVGLSLRAFQRGRPGVEPWRPARRRTSELVEGQLYRLPARRVDATVTWHYK